jgi:hypothetical protein
MALGDSNVTPVPGGGQQRQAAASAVRNVILLGVCTAGTPNEPVKPSSLTGISAGLGSGPLAELAGLLFRPGQQLWCVPVTPSAVGGVTAVTQVGTGSGALAVSIAPHKAIKVKCETGGALATATFQFSLDGGVTYGAPVLSTSTSFVYRVPGTFTTLTFAAATYVATKTLTVGIDGTVTPGSAWVGTVTQVSSPVDNYDVVCTVQTGGALGVATIQVSLDGGRTTMPTLALPASGKVVIPGTGLVLTPSNTFVAGETYSFLAAAPGYSSSDVTAALDALAADVTAPQSAIVEVAGLPSSSANAFALLSTLESELETLAIDDKLKYQGHVECPVVGDTICSSGTVSADTVDDEATIRAARAATADCNFAALSAGTHRIFTPLNKLQLKRPTGWAILDRYVDTDPAQSLAAPEPFGPLRVKAIGRDELTAAISLHDVQINVLQTRRGLNGVYLAIESEGFAFRNLTTQVDFQDAESMRLLNAALAALTVEGLRMLAQRPPVNPDGTIEEKTARGYDKRFDLVMKQTVGLARGGSFATAQASQAFARVLRSSQLGSAPHKLEIEYGLQPLGFISDVAGKLFYSGTLTVTGS